jgi:AcrR family transcriptional regulator
MLRSGHVPSRTLQALNTDTLSRMDTASRNEPVPIWEREDPGRYAPVVPLRRDDVAATAIEMADAEGLAAVSVRRLAAALGVGPMRLYRVFDTVEELTDLMVDAVYGEIVVACRPRGDWRARIRQILTRSRTGLLAHEWMADLLGIRPHLGPNGLAWMEMLAGAIGQTPTAVSPDAIWAAMGTVNGYLVGAVRREVADRRSGRIGDGRLEWQARMAPYVRRMLETGRYPALRDLIVHRGDPDPDASFGHEVDILLRGLGD